MKNASFKAAGFGFGYLLIGALYLALGVCFLLFRETLSVLAYVIGGVVILAAILFFVVTLSRAERDARFAFSIALAATLLVAGIVTLIFNENTMSVIVSLLSLFLVIDGSFKLHTSAMARRFHSVFWWILTVFAVTVIAGGFYLLRFTPDDFALTSIFLAVTLCLAGIANVFTPFFSRRYLRVAVREEEAPAPEAPTDPAE